MNHDRRPRWIDFGFFLLITALVLFVVQFGTPEIRRTTDTFRDDIVAAITSVIVAGAALFVSFAALYWSQGIDSLFSYLKWIIDKHGESLRKGNALPDDQIREIIGLIRSHYDRYERYRFILSILYYLVVIFAIMVILGLLLGRVFFRNGMISPKLFGEIVDTAITVTLFIIIAVLVGVMLITTTHPTHQSIQIQREILRLGMGDTEGE